MLPIKQTGNKKTGMPVFFNSIYYIVVKLYTKQNPLKSAVISNALPTKAICKTRYF